MVSLQAEGEPAAKPEEDPYHRGEAELIRQLNNFVYATSHDLQEPLRNILEFCKILKEDHADKLDADGRECVAYIVKGSERLQAMVRGLLQFSRTQRAEIIMEQVDIGAVIAAALLEVQIENPDRDIQIKTDTPPTIQTDERLISMVLTELVRNAVKFTPNDRAVHIEIACLFTGSGFEIHIHDEGIGLDEDRASNVFDIFQRLVPRSQFDGVGVGLSICREAVHRLGGTISAHSGEVAGTTMKLRLPLPPLLGEA